MLMSCAINLIECMNLLLKLLTASGIQLGKETITFYEYLTSPAAKILNRWFETDVLKATLATDAIVGAMTSPMLPGSG